jgi:hypothetical protein
MNSGHARMRHQDHDSYQSRRGIIMNHDEQDRINDDNNYYEDQQRDEWERHHRRNSDDGHDADASGIGALLFAGIVLVLIISMFSNFHH